MLEEFIRDLCQQVPESERIMSLPISLHEEKTLRYDTILGALRAFNVLPEDQLYAVASAISETRIGVIEYDWQGAGRLIEWHTCSVYSSSGTSPLIWINVFSSP